MTRNDQQLESACDCPRVPLAAPELFWRSLAEQEVKKPHLTHRPSRSSPIADPATSLSRAETCPSMISKRGGPSPPNDSTPSLPIQPTSSGSPASSPTRSTASRLPYHSTRRLCHHPSSASDSCHSPMPPPTPNCLAGTSIATILLAKHKLELERLSLERKGLLGYSSQKPSLLPAPAPRPTASTGTRRTTALTSSKTAAPEAQRPFPP
jgi:hypothetical protein